MMETGNHPPPAPASHTQVPIPQPDQLDAWEQSFWPHFLPIPPGRRASPGGSVLIQERRA